MTNFQQLTKEFTIAADAVRASQPIKGRGFASGVTRGQQGASPFQDYFDHVAAQRFHEPQDKKDFLQNFETTLELFTKGLPAAVDIEQKSGKLWPRVVRYTVDFPTALKMFKDGEFVFNTAQGIAKGDLSYNELRGTAGVENLIALAKAADADISFDFHFNSGIRKVDIGGKTGGLHGQTSPSLLVSIDFDRPFDAAKYPTPVAAPHTSPSVGIKP